MLYPKNKSENLDMELFKNPTAEYRGAPFWAWNCEPNKDVLLEQIECLKKMGFGGVHIHSRAGMATEYLGTEFFELIKACIDKAKKENMFVYLYDEDRWPSGSAGGIVTKNRKYRSRFLEFTKNKEENTVDEKTGINEGRTYLFACYDVEISKDGSLKSYNIIEENEQASHEKWYAYIKTQDDNPYFNGSSYADTLSEEAVNKFIEVTHEAYKKHIGEEFSLTVPSIFTDEPQYVYRKPIEHACTDESVIYPWTPYLPQKYSEKYGEDLKKTLPEVFWDLPCGKPSRTRYLYNDITCELFVSSFMDNLSKWCQKNNIKLTGHVLHEESLFSQTQTEGETMRCYRNMDIPGIDMLCNGLELTTAKQAQSVVRQYGREAMMSELYGVTKWTFDFRGHKYQGDWQAAMGVTLRVPHLSWVSMKGRAKRDYPASINCQSPWFGEYSYIENHFARLNTVLTRGKPIVDVAVIHPVESYWIHWGADDANAEYLEDLNTEFVNIIDWLTRGLIDFDFLSESLLAENGSVENDTVVMKKMKYKTVIVPNCETIRRSTFEILKKFKNNGGRLIFVGNCPKYIDVEESEEPIELYNKSIKTQMRRSEVLQVADKERFIDIRLKNGKRTDKFVYTLRQDNNVKWLFVAHLDMPKITDFCEKEELRIELKGKFIPRLYDTLTGSIQEVNYTYNGGKTVIFTEVYEYDSLLFELEDGEKECGYIQKEKIQVLERYDIKHAVDYSTEEKNVYLLDMAEYSLDGGNFEPKEEILRIDKKCRELLNFPEATIDAEQPWALEKEKTEHFVTLRYTIKSEIEYCGALIAAESADYIELNGEKTEHSANGYYVDRSILTYPLPKIVKGINTLTVKVPFGKRTGVESLYLLGDFGVEVFGCEKCITQISKKVNFGSTVAQKMPFYSGNITYKFTVDTKNDGKMKITAGHYRGALISVKVDGKDVGKIAFSPYSLITEKFSKGLHTIEMTLFGNRANTFGALHNYGDCWWYDGSVWYPEKYMSYEYMFEDMGILSSPIIEIIK